MKIKKYILFSGFIEESVKILSTYDFNTAYGYLHILGPMKRLNINTSRVSGGMNPYVPMPADLEDFEVELMKYGIMNTIVTEHPYKIKHYFKIFDGDFSYLGTESEIRLGTKLGLFQFTKKETTV